MLCFPEVHHTPERTLKLASVATVQDTPPDTSPDHEQPPASTSSEDGPKRPVVELFTDDPTPEQAADKAEEILTQLVKVKGGSRREGQVQLARNVAMSLVNSVPLLAEGGTGVGKSLAYLAGALASGKTSVVGTHTKALQDQLVNDLDALFDQIDFNPPINHALLKGRSAYACLKKVKGGPDADAPADLFEGEGEGSGQPRTKLGEDITKLHAWVDEQLEGREKGLPKSNGDRTDVPFAISGQAWNQISVSADDCLGKGCPFFEECFAEEAKVKAAEADIVIANQAIVAMSMAIPHAKILPPDVEAIIIDEAHEMQNVVADTFGAEITMKRLNNAVKRCKVMVDAGAKSVEDLQESATNSIAALFAAVKLDPKKRSDRQFMTPKVETALKACRERFRSLSDRSSMLPQGDEAQKATKDLLRRTLGNVIDDLELVLEGNTDTQVTWASYNSAFDITTLHAAQFDVSEVMFEKLIKEYKSVVFTSATMTVGGTFDHIAEACGFTNGPWTCGIAASPFDYANVGMIYHPDGAPDLKSPEYSGWVASEAGKLAEWMGGRTMVLCSSWKSVDEISEAIEQQFPKINVIAQERNGSSFRRLQDRFITEPNSILIGTQTLWTGVSFEGDTCTAVVIDKIPFPSPEDPIKAAQVEAADRKYGKWEGFSRISVPAAATKMTQGSGRLIRTVADRGVLMVMDPRLRKGSQQYKRMYATKILRSMPPLRSVSSEAEVRAFAENIAKTATD